MSRQRPPRSFSTAPGGKGRARHSIGLALVWLAVLLGVVLALLIGPHEDWQAIHMALIGTGLAVAITFLMIALRRMAALTDQVGEIRAEIAQLQRQIAEQVQPAVSPVAQTRIDALAAAQEQTDTRLTLFFSRRGREATAPKPEAEGEPLLALGDQADRKQISPSPTDLIRALHFPEDANDRVGFEALRKALADSRTAPLIRAAQEVLTHLSQDGIYMDDLRPDRAKPEFWRAFAQGTRGPLIAPLGGIRDRSCLALTAARMRNNPDFKAAAHLFLREFDKVFANFEKEADDAQIVALSETRSARAFMLLGRVSGVFSQ